MNDKVKVIKTHYYCSRKHKPSIRRPEKRHLFKMQLGALIWMKVSSSDKIFNRPINLKIKLLLE